MDCYLNNIESLLTIKAKEHYDNVIKIPIARFQTRHIYVTEFLYAKIQSLLENHHGHKEIDDFYVKLLPYVFVHYDEIIIDTRNNREIVSIFDHEGRRIFHVIDENDCLVSIFVMRKETFARSKKYIIKSVREGGVSSILSPAMPFWRHTDLIEELYQKLRQSIMKLKQYLITDPSFYGTTPDHLESALDVIYSHRLPDFALFRDKQTSEYSTLAQTFVTISHEYKIPHVLLHSDYALAHELGVDVHLTSSQFEDIAQAKQLGLYVIISTHTHEEALRAQELGADAITYSPIFFSPNKGEPKGLEDLKEIVAKIRVPIFALGGITTDEQTKAVEKCGAYGFASIRYFI